MLQFEDMLVAQVDESLESSHSMKHQEHVFALCGHPQQIREDLHDFSEFLSVRFCLLQQGAKKVERVLNRNVRNILDVTCRIVASTMPDC